MNYLWQLLLQVQEQKIDLKSIRFKPATSYSPYMELSQNQINNTELQTGQEIEINPYYRFYAIFKNMFIEDITDYAQLRDGLFHLIIHAVAENDLKQGMNRMEYYKKFIYQDILDGFFGSDLSESIDLFTISERNTILGGLIKMYVIGDSIELLKDMLTAAFTNIIMYNNTCNKNEILVYIGNRKTKVLERKMEAILKLFANIRYTIEIYYEHHFAILGMDETLSIEEIALY